LISRFGARPSSSFAQTLPLLSLAMLVSCLWLGLAAAADGLGLVSRSSSGQAAPPATEEAAFFDNGQWAEIDGKYTWELNQGSMDNFDVDQFCKDLPGDVLLVGDSIMHQHYESLIQEACPHRHKRVAAPCWYTENDKKKLVVENGCCNGTRVITHIRNDIVKTHGPDRHWEPAKCRSESLGRKNDDYVEPSDNNTLFEDKADEMAEARRPKTDVRLLSWDFPEIISRFKVFILNTGAHYQPDPEYRELVQGVVDVFQRHPEVDKRYVFWRTTMLGVSDCEEMDGKPPFRSLEEAEKHYAEHPWYESADFKRQNEMAKSIIASTGISIIDVYKASMMNGHSGHVNQADCLHYNMTTGQTVYKHWNRHFYNLIRRRAGSLP